MVAMLYRLPFFKLEKKQEWQRQEFYLAKPCHMNISYYM